MTLEESKKYTVWLIIYLIFMGLSLRFIQIVRDNTDPEYPMISGMILTVNAETGCEYLSIPHGGITPRFDKQGQHLGCK